MKKIVGILQPFAFTQTFYVYEDGNKLDILNTDIEEIPSKITELVGRYSIEEIELIGPKKYAQGIGNKIKEKALLKYNDNKLEIKYI